MAWRAFWFAARDAAADLLRGIGGAEEAADIPPEKFMGAAVVVPAPKQEERPTWPADAFAKRLPNWQAAINAGKTADEILVFARSKGDLSVEQEAAIRALKPQTPAQAAGAQPAAAGQGGEQ